MKTKKNLKITKAVRFDPRDLAEVEKYKEISGGLFTLSWAVNKGLKKELVLAKKEYGK